MGSFILMVRSIRRRTLTKRFLSTSAKWQTSTKWWQTTGGRSSCAKASRSKIAPRTAWGTWFWCPRPQPLSFWMALTLGSMGSGGPACGLGKSKSRVVHFEGTFTAIFCFSRRAAAKGRPEEHQLHTKFFARNLSLGKAGVWQGLLWGFLSTRHSNEFHGPHAYRFCSSNLKIWGFQLRLCQDETGMVALNGFIFRFPIPLKHVDCSLHGLSWPSLSKPVKSSVFGPFCYSTSWNHTLINFFLWPLLANSAKPFNRGNMWRLAHTHTHIYIYIYYT